MKEHTYKIDGRCIDEVSLINEIRRKKALIEKTGKHYPCEDRADHSDRGAEGYVREYISEEHLSDEDIILMIEQGPGNYLDLKEDKNGLFSHIKEAPEIVHVEVICIHKEEPFDKLGSRKSIGMKISSIRNSKGLTQEDLAILAGIDRTNVSKIEKGKYNVSVDILNNICSALDCRLDILEN